MSYEQLSALIVNKVALTTLIFNIFIIVMPCSPPNLPAQSNVQMNDGYNIHYACNLGYQLTAGHLQRHCQVGDLWNGTEPNCTCKDS